MNVFDKYLKKSAPSNVLNLKVLLLTEGLDFDFPSLRKKYPKLKKDYKVNKIRVSDRHFLDPKSGERDFVPDELIISEGKDRSVVKTYFKKQSPFLFAIRNGDFVILDKKTKKIFPVSISPVPLYNYAKKKNKGVPLDEFVSVVGLDKVSIIPYDGCENWLHGEQCKFCGANPNRMGFMGIKPNILEIKSKYNGDIKKWWSNCRDYMRDNTRRSFQELMKDGVKPHFHFSIISGNLSDLDYEWDMCFDLLDSIKDLVDFSKVDSYFNLMPPKNLKNINKAKRYGFKYMCFNLECFDRKIFKTVCPGKEKVYGYKRIIDALEYSVSVFGKGRVRTNFVLGAEPLDGLLKGAKKLAKVGIISDYTVFFPRPGSVWSGREILSPQKVLDFTAKITKVYKEYGFKPFCCSLSSRSSIANEFYNI